MKKTTPSEAIEQPIPDPRSVLDEICRAGAIKMLQHCIEMEAAGYLERHAGHVDEQGHRLVVRNGHLPERNLVTGIGPVQVKQPRVLDKRPGERFTSRILPPYMRRLPSIDALIPCLYLKGISTGDFSEALEAILGPQAKGLSPTNIVRLKEVWTQEHEQWSKRDLSGEHYVYVWVDGVHFNVRLDDERSCILVVMGATADGQKRLLAVHDGYRESTLSWTEVLRDLVDRGLGIPPALAVGDGALGFWKAADEVWPPTRRQRCWVHKTANVLDKMPRGVQSKAKARLHDMYLAPTRKDALGAYEAFLSLYRAKYPKACECLEKDREDLFTFYDFPAEHWVHLRSTNPIESTFATVRLRTHRTKGCGSRAATLSMVFKLAQQAEKHWRKLNGSHLIAKVIEGVKFVDGEIQKAA